MEVIKYRIVTALLIPRGIEDKIYVFSNKEKCIYTTMYLYYFNIPYKYKARAPILPYKQD